MKIAVTASYQATQIAIGTLYQYRIIAVILMYWSAVCAEWS